MELVEKKLTELKPYPNNPRINDQAVEAVMESIRQCEYVAPIIVDEDDVILAGHTRLKALQRLGEDSVEVLVREGLTEEQKKKYRLLDNKTAEMSEWDMERLVSELENLDFDGFDFGFIEEEKEKKIVEKPEVEFTEELLEENNYIVLFFDNSIDWLQAQTVFGLEPKKALDSKKGFERIGMGRVIDGTEILNRLVREGEGTDGD